MKRFVQGQERSQSTLFPACLDEYISDDNPVRVVDVFVEELDLHALGAERVIPQATGRPTYHPAALLKIYIYGYLNRIPSSRRLEQETGRCHINGEYCSVLVNEKSRVEEKQRLGLCKSRPCRPPQNSIDPEPTLIRDVESLR